MLKLEKIVINLRYNRFAVYLVNMVEKKHMIFLWFTCFISFCTAKWNERAINKPKESAFSNCSMSTGVARKTLAGHLALEIVTAVSYRAV